MTVEPEFHPQCAFAMGKLLERLVGEDYIHPERKSELLDRARNLGNGHGFLTAAELKRRGKTPTEDQELEDLLS